MYTMYDIYLSLYFMIYIYFLSIILIRSGGTLPTAIIFYYNNSNNSGKLWKEK